MKPLTFIFRVALFGVIPVLIQACNSSEAQLAGKNQQDQYQCLPCGSDCDSKTYTAAGECSGCHMQLVKKSSVKHHSISPAEICDYIKKHPEAILLDVRTKREFEGKDRPNYGTLKNAINIPVQQLESKLASISHLKDKEILVYC
jgi:hypothetical protein